MVNEISQGPGGAREYAELLVIGNPTCDSNCVDIRGWIIDDNNGTFAPGTGQGIAPGCIRFGFDPQWACVKMGAIIVVYNSGDKNQSLPPDDPTDANGDCVYILPEWNPLLDGAGGQPSSTNPSYVGLTFSPSGAWSTQSMNNSQDSYQTRDPNNLGVPHHAVSWGSNNMNNIIYFAGSAGGTVFYNDNTVTNDPYSQANWASGPAPANETPGAPNSPANAAWISTMSNNCMPFGGADSTLVDTSVCQGDSLFIAGAWRSSAGTYVDTFTNSGGCDSLLITTLSLDSVYDYFRAVTICEGDSFYAGGGWQNSPDGYSDAFTTVDGCDSLIFTALNVIYASDTLDSLSICSGDSVLIHGNYESTAGTYRDTLLSSLGCDSIRSTVILTLINPVVNSVSNSVCLGDSLLFGGIWRDTAGVYFDTLTGTNTCDSIVQLTLTVESPTYDSSVFVGCIGDTIFVFDGLSVTMPGIYFDTLGGASSCDSVIFVAEAIFNAPTLDSTSSFICSGDSIFIGGQWRYTSGIYFDTLSSVIGCDSIVEIDLTVGSATVTFVPVVICQGDSFFAQGAWQDTTGTYFDTISAGTCDSIVATQLTVNPNTQSNQSVAICPGDSVFLQGAWQDTAGTYFDTIPNQFTCDSVIITSLTILATPTTPVLIAICQGDSAFVGGDWQTSPGLYYDTLSTSNGCDSIIETDLSVIPPVFDTAVSSICQGDSIFLAGSWRYTSGIYTDTLISSLSCDSFYSTDLTVIVPIFTSQPISICEGDSVFAGGSWQTTTGNYFDTLLSASFCDSVHETQLTVIPIVRTNSAQSICSGDSAFLGGEWRFTSGSYYDTGVSAQLCDSIHETALTVVQPVNGSTTTSICAGDSIFLGGDWQNSAGIYIDTITAVSGCDSILSTQLRIINPRNGQASITICDGDSYFAGGGFQTQPGVYYDTLVAANGCDSIHRTDLSVRPNPIVFPNNPQRSVCLGDSVFLVGPSTPPNLTYLWSTGETSQSIWAGPDIATAYNLSVTDAFGCQGTGTIVVVPIDFEVTATATPDTVIYLENSRIFAGGDPAVTYRWRPFDYLDNAFASSSNVVAIEQTTTYELTATSDSGCTDVDSVTVYVIQPDQTFTLPTAFSPNGDGVNDIYRVLNPGQWDITIFQVYNRWGELVYDIESDDPIGWDGTYKGQPQPIATYTYYVGGFSTISGEEHFQKGTVTLIR